MGTLTVQPGQIKNLADPSNGQAERYRIFIENNASSQARLKFADRRKNAKTGTEVLGGEQIQIALEEGDNLFAFNPSNNPVNLSINPQGLTFLDRSTVIQNASIRTDEVGLAKNSTLQNIATNQTSIISGSDTGGGTLPSNNVAPGRTVRVQAKPGNGSTVSIDGNFQLQPGQAVDLAVTNTDKISYTATSGDGVEFIVEQ